MTLSIAVYFRLTEGFEFSGALKDVLDLLHFKKIDLSNHAKIICLVRTFIKNITAVLRVGYSSLRDFRKI